VGAEQIELERVPAAFGSDGQQNPLFDGPAHDVAQPARG
jgi:hypothetical protein